MIKLVYIAGPYTGKTPWEIECNIHRARVVGAKVAALGALPVIPHANTAHFDNIQPASFFIEGTLELLRRCDAVVVLENSQASKGTQGEIAEAKRLGMPLFEIGVGACDLAEWIGRVRGEP